MCHITCGTLHYQVIIIIRVVVASCLGFPLDNKEANLRNTALHAGKGQLASRFVNGNKLVVG